LHFLFTQQTTSTIKCSKHKEQISQWFCTTCELAYCQECDSTDHLGHKVVPVAQIPQYFQEELKAMLGKAELRLPHLLGVKDKIEEHITTINKVSIRALERKKMFRLQVD